MIGFRCIFISRHAVRGCFSNGLWEGLLFFPRLYVTAFLPRCTSSTMPFVPKPLAKVGKEMYKWTKFSFTASSCECCGSRGFCLLASRLGLMPSLSLLDCKYTNSNLCATAVNLFGHGSNAAACNTQSKGMGNISRPGNSAASDRRTESLGLSVEIRDGRDARGEADESVILPTWTGLGC